MKTSIVMATYNGEAYLQEQLSSLFLQSVPPDELIIADDGSSDNTISIIKSMMNCPPFRISLVQRKQRLGYARNFAEASLQASGEIILFCDQDDYWETEKIRIIKDWFHTHPEKSLAIHNISICDKNLTPTIDDYFSYLEHNYAKHFFLKGCATAATKSLIASAFPLPHPSSWHHDTRVHALARINNKHGYISDILIKHRIHSKNTSGYIVNQKGIGGRFLAKLDRLATSRLPNWAQLLPLIGLPKADEELIEFLIAGNRLEIEPLFLKTVNKIRQRDALMSGGKSKFTQSLRLLQFYLSGGYQSIGQSPKYIVDAIRLLKF